MLAHYLTDNIDIKNKYSNYLLRFLFIFLNKLLVKHKQV